MSRVVVCSWATEGGALARGVEETLTLGRELAVALGADLVLFTLGDLPSDAQTVAARHGANATEHAADPRLAAGEPDALVEALVQRCTDSPPRAMLFPQSFGARLVVPRVAGRLRAPILMNVAGVGVENGRLHVTALAYGGDTRAVYEVAGDGPAILSVSTSAIRAESAATASAPSLGEVAVRLGSVAERVRVVERAKPAGPRLEDAGIIVAGGRGLGSRESYALIEQLADALGGLPGASRPLVDDGWVDASRQVGLTGHITRPSLYVAVGISGASQHMAGCSAAKTLVAINSDADAAIFKHARFGIVGDCKEILPELIRAARERRTGGG